MRRKSPRSVLIIDARFYEDIADELARDDLEYKIPQWIQLAEASLARFLDMKDGEQFTTGVFVPDQAYIDFPVGFKSAIHIEIQLNQLRILSSCRWRPAPQCSKTISRGRPAPIT